MTHVLAVDVGTTSVRVARVDDAGRVLDERRTPTPPRSPAPGLVEFDAAELADATVALAQGVAGAGPVVAGVGIAAQRASVVAWDRRTGIPVGPGIGWQDLRTAGRCLELQARGLRFMPNQSATKLEWLLARVPSAQWGELALGTVDTFVAWHLSGGQLHVTDASNAAVTGLLRGDASSWNDTVLETLGLPLDLLPDVVDSMGPVGPAAALPGEPPISGILGDQQASLIGQGGVRAGTAKITFGTGAMLDLCTGPGPAPSGERSEHGTFPIVAWRDRSGPVWGVEAIALAAGACVDWLCDELGVLAEPSESAAVAAECQDAGEVVFVPALSGLGTPSWDLGARGIVVGLTRGTGRPELVRAVLEGVAHTGADLVEAAEADTGVTLPTLRVDGGMSTNEMFLQALADACGRPVEPASVTEATVLGAGFAAGVGAGVWPSLAGAAAIAQPRRRVEPSRRDPHRDRWREAVARASGWEAGLSAVRF